MGESIHHHCDMACGHLTKLNTPEFIGESIHHHHDTDNNKGRRLVVEAWAPLT